jgi:hypothetical protein
MVELDSNDDHAPPPPPHKPAPVLPYGVESPDRTAAAGRGVGQFVLGIVSYAAISGTFLYLGGVAHGGTEGLIASYIAAVLVVLLGGGWLRVRHGWHAFIPGVLTGIAVTCLVPPIAIFVICGGFRR